MVRFKGKETKNLNHILQGSICRQTFSNRAHHPGTNWEPEPPTLQEPTTHSRRKRGRTSVHYFLMEERTMPNLLDSWQIYTALKYKRENILAVL